MTDTDDAHSSHNRKRAMYYLIIEYNANRIEVCAAVLTITPTEGIIKKSRELLHINSSIVRNI